MDRFVIADDAVKIENDRFEHWDRPDLSYFNRVITPDLISWVVRSRKLQVLVPSLSVIVGDAPTGCRALPEQTKNINTGGKCYGNFGRFFSQVRMSQHKLRAPIFF